jgi:WD40 repeat protein
MSRYSVVHLPAHLSLLGRKDELRRLLFDFGWIYAKLEATDVNFLIKDYEFLPNDKKLSLVKSALSISAHVLTQDKTQLQSQLYGRLMRKNTQEIEALLDQIMKWKKGPWLCTLSPSLMPPGGPLIRTLEGHAKSVNAVAVFRDSKRAISASEDSTLKVWDIESGEVLRTFDGHTDRVNAIAVMPDGKRATSASDDKTIKIWDIDSGENISSFNGDSPLSTCTVSPEGKTIIVGEASGRVHFLRLEGAD